MGAVTGVHTSEGSNGVTSVAGVAGEIARSRAKILGCDIDRVDMERALQFCDEVIRSRGFAQHMAINVAKLVAMRKDAQLRWGVERCELVTADGQPVVWASRLLGDPLPSRVAGIDLMHGLLALAALKEYRVYILGARPEVLELAVDKIRTQYPGICIAGYRDGYYDAEDEEAVAATIAESKADILFVAMSSPRKEYFLLRHGRTIGVPFVMGVGGAIDVLAGLTRRAPAAMQRTGLEWLFRFAQEPRRLGPRYATTNTRFVALLSRELVHAYVGRHSPRMRFRLWTTRASRTRLVSLPSEAAVAVTVEPVPSEPAMAVTAEPLPPEPAAEVVAGVTAVPMVRVAVAGEPDRPRTAAGRIARHELTHLRALEAEAIHVMREVGAELERPVLLFSGGKDSIVLLRLAEKAFRPGRFPFPVMHVDTGHNFPEAIDFRDRRMAELGERLIVASVQESIDRGRVVEETGPRASRNRLQTITLLDAIAEHGFDALIGGARRDEERARAKERIFSFRDDFGQWEPRLQRPEVWNLYNARIRGGEHVRVFPISNWTELDVWRYIAEEGLEIPPLYFGHRREVFRRDGMLYAVSPFVRRLPDEVPFVTSVRYRTVGDMTCTGAVESTAATVEAVIAEISATRLTERGETRADDRVSEAAMEDRKRAGYF
jgi:sulfate adenylyltransferase subunit 2